MPGYRYCLSPHHQDGSSTKGNEGDHLHLTLSNSVPLLANNRKDTFQALHTSFVNTAIDNMKDNKVLNNRPPPINDEENLYRDDKGQLYHSSVPDIVNYWIPTKSDWSKVILQVVQTVEWIHRMYLACLIAWLTPKTCHLWTYGTSQSRRYENWAFWIRATRISRWGWLKRANNNNVHGQFPPPPQI